MSVDDDQPGCENQALIDAVTQNAEVEILTLDAKGVEVLSVPSGRTLVAVRQYLEPYRTAPERRRGTAKLTTLQSFCDHVSRFRDAHSALFADDNAKAPKLVGVLDYHEATASGSPRFGVHRALYDFPIADEWKVWTSTVPMAQAAFAEFIEDHIGDVLDPKSLGESTWAFVEQLEIVLATPSALMGLSKGLSVYVDSRATNKIDLGSGEGQLSFNEEHKDSQGAPLKVPRGFAVGIPVFTGGERYSLPIRLRYRVSAGKVTWELKPHRVELAFRHAVTEACDKAAGLTKLPLFYGAPEQG